MERDPIIFMHYGDSDYLSLTLKYASENNPNTEVILIGDEVNKKYQGKGVTHHLFEAYSKGELAKKFIEAYELIGGVEFIRINNSKGFDWTKFNFLKWFVLHEFLVSKGIKRCWTFDSDNLIMNDLSSIEDWFVGHDCTTRAKQSMILGKINNLTLLKEYIQNIVKLFYNKEYLVNQKEDFISNPNHGFTMMRAFWYFIDNMHGKFSIGNVEKRNGRDQFNIVLIGDSEYENSGVSHPYGPIKKLYALNGKTYLMDKYGELVRLMVLDLSWLPIYFYKSIIQTTEKSINAEIPIEISFATSFDYRIRNKFYRFRKKYGLAK